MVLCQGAKVPGALLVPGCQGARCAAGARVPWCKVRCLVPGLPGCGGCTSGERGEGRRAGAARRSGPVLLHITYYLNGHHFIEQRLALRLHQPHPRARDRGSRHTADPPHGSPPAQQHPDPWLADRPDSPRMAHDLRHRGHPIHADPGSQAWRRLGLLKPSESFTRASYVACVSNVASTLREEQRLSDAVAAWYVEQAKTAPWPDRVK
jgi:hypothetical protein